MKCAHRKVSRKGRAAWFVMPLLMLIGLGCPYSFSGSSLPSHIRTIGIPVFENESLDATIAN
ncbi:MAG: hypothetical protein KAY24_05300, partial [Candidatus Eisenbacteria sp.]|nr:hypothetical protein [Candidatus Eisenbacteria bacterium]